MTISLQDDSDGNTYQLWGQRQANSCAVASIWMARGIARQMTFDESEWELAHRTYNAAVAGMDLENAGGTSAPQSLNPASYPAGQTSMENTFASTGINLGQVTAMLRHEGFTAGETADTTINAAKVGLTKPALVAVIWRKDSTNVARGGHCIVAARINSNQQVVYLDPGNGGQLRELPNNGLIPHPNRSYTGHVEGVTYIADPSGAA